MAKKYVVERVLGEGGMGVVVAAQHTQLRQRVAIKFILPSVLSNPEAVGRFVREARASVQIQSEHVARVIDVGELESGAPYIVMEYLEGTDLSNILESTQRPSPETVVEYVLQACEALAEAHSLGIVHRDLKPANLFVTRRPDGSPLVKVLDFGISKSADSTDHALTKTTAFVGSPLYASPEQILSSRTVDLRTDIWALGVILYEACAGVPPFTGESVMEVAARVMQVAPRPLASLRPDLPEALTAVVMRCLEKDVTQRFATIGELARALGPHAPNAALSVERISRMLPPLSVQATAGAVSGVARTVSMTPPVRASTPVPTSSPPAAPASTQVVWDQRLSRGVADRPPASRARPIALVAGALLVLGTAVVVVTSRRPASVATPEVYVAPALTAPSPPAAGAVTSGAPGAGPVPPPPESSTVAAPDPPIDTIPAAPSASAASARPAAVHPTRALTLAHASATPPAAGERPPPTVVTPPPPTTPPPSTASAGRNPLDIKIK